MKYTPLEPEPPDESPEQRRARLARHHILNATLDFTPTAKYLALSGLPANYRTAAPDDEDDFFE